MRYQLADSCKLKSISWRLGGESSQCVMAIAPTRGKKRITGLFYKKKRVQMQGQRVKKFFCLAQLMMFALGFRLFILFSSQLQSVRSDTALIQKAAIYRFF